MMRFDKDPFNMVVCGVGGQGNILLSRMIGRIMIQKNYKVDIGETFGAAQRGGSVFSSLRISKNQNYGPLIPEGHADIVLSLEPLETLRMLSIYGNPEIITVFNSQPVLPVGVLAKRFDYPELETLVAAIEKLSRKSWSLDATAMALGLDAPIVANIIMMGALVGSGTLPISMDDVRAEIKKSFPAGKVDLNLKALDMGCQAVSES